MVLIQVRPFPRLGTQKEVRTFVQFDHRNQRFACLERQMCFLMRSDLAHECPPPVVLAQLVSTDNEEDKYGS